MWNGSHFDHFLLLIQKRRQHPLVELCIAEGQQRVNDLACHQLNSGLIN